MRLATILCLYGGLYKLTSQPSSLRRASEGGRVLQGRRCALGLLGHLMSTPAAVSSRACEIQVWFVCKVDKILQSGLTSRKQKIYVCLGWTLRQQC